ncbi:MAG TPA: mannosyltransferase family protein [Thermomicrobiales bacterium]
MATIRTDPQRRGAALAWPTAIAFRRLALAPLITHRVALTAFLAHIVLVFGAVALAMAAFSSEAPVRAVGDTPIPMSGPARYLIEPLANWDGQWYTMLARYGYWARDPVQDPSSAAFWPLYPLLLRLGAALTGWSPATVGVLLSNMAFLLALVVLHRLVRLDYGAAIAGRTVWGLALFPVAFFFSAVYTESLFLLLIVGAVYCGRIERWREAALLGFFAALTRNTGVLVLLPLGGLLMRHYGPDPRRWWRIALPLALVPLAPALFMGYQWWVSGDFLLTIHVQRKFTRAPMSPWNAVFHGFRRFDPFWFRESVCFTSGGQIGPRACIAELRREAIPYNQVLMLPVFLLLVPLFRRVERGYALFVLAGLAVPLCNPWGADPFVTMPRFAMVLFPLFIALGIVLHRRAHRIAWFTFSILALVGLTIQFSTWFPVI